MIDSLKETELMNNLLNEVKKGAYIIADTEFKVDFLFKQYQSKNRSADFAIKILDESLSGQKCTELRLYGENDKLLFSRKANIERKAGGADILYIYSVKVRGEED